MENVQRNKALTFVGKSKFLSTLCANVTAWTVIGIMVSISMTNPTVSKAGVIYSFMLSSLIAGAVSGLFALLVPSKRKRVYIPVSMVFTLAGALIWGYARGIM